MITKMEVDMKYTPYDLEAIAKHSGMTVKAVLNRLLVLGCQVDRLREVEREKSK